MADERNTTPGRRPPPAADATQQDREIKPCPFCGRAPRRMDRPSDHAQLWIISCMCGGYSARAHIAATTEAEAVRRWNTRPAEASLAAERDRLRAALKMLAQCRHVSGSAQGAFRCNLRITDAVLAGADVRDFETVKAIVNGEWKPEAKGGGE